MGRRLLRVSPDLFIEFFKERSGAPRSYTINDPLPDDARVVAQRWLSHPAGAYEAATLGIVIESDTWAGDWDGIENDPSITVRYEATV